MRTIALLTKSTLALAAPLALLAATAEALPPIGKEIKLDAKVKTAADQNAVRHGMHVAITLKNKKRVTGTVVWTDPADDSLLIRARPGAVPEKIAGNNIQSIDRIRLTSASGAVVADEPEIFQTEVMNGNLRTIRYFAPTLSPGEKSQLSDLEAAENEAARMQLMQSQLGQATQEQVQMLRSQSTLAAREAEIMGIYQTELSWLTSFSPYLSTPGLGGARGGFLPQGSVAALLPAMGGGSFSGPATATALDGLINRQLSLKEMAAKASQNLTTVRARGLYEGGTLVAVRPAPAPAIRPVANQEKK